MEALKFAPEYKNNVSTLNTKAKIAEYAQLSDAALLKLFPLPRYFQIHFQHIHENSELFKEELTELKHTTQQLNAKLDMLIQLLTQADI
jgi:hypothetical protein